MQASPHCVLTGRRGGDDRPGFDTFALFRRDEDRQRLFGKAGQRRFGNGTGAGLGIFTREILPLVKALRAGDGFATAAIIRKTSPLLDRDALRDAGEAQQGRLDRAKGACAGLLALVDGQPPASLRDVLRYVAEHRLFTVPDVLLPFATADPDPADEDDADENEEEVDNKSETAAWRQALEAPFDQVDKYDRYVRGVSQFDTHQGVKGLEFPRVMVVISDEEARGFLFNYDKLFGAKGKSKTDLDNEAAGKETTIDRTRRLFYVTCSRAERSLAVVYYAENPTASRDALLQQGWFAEDEIEVVG